MNLVEGYFFQLTSGQLVQGLQQLLECHLIAQNSHVDFCLRHPFQKIEVNSFGELNTGIE
jgi:hypothetical protein